MKNIFNRWPFVVCLHCGDIYKASEWEKGACCPSSGCDGGPLDRIEAKTMEKAEEISDYHRGSGLPLEVPPASS